MGCLLQMCLKLHHNKMEKYLRAIDLTKIKEITDETDLNGQVACSGGACEIV